MTRLRLLTLIANGPRGELHDPIDGNSFLADVFEVLTEVARSTAGIALMRVSSLAQALRVVTANPAEHLQLVGHGGRGELELGCSWDTRCFVPEVIGGSAIRAWLAALPQEVTDVYLVGCDVGSGDQPGEGHALLRELASATSAAVYAATGPALACLFDDVSGNYHGAMARYNPLAGAMVQVPAQRTCPRPAGPWHPPDEPPRLRFTHLRYQRRGPERLVGCALSPNEAADLANSCHLTSPGPDGGCVVEKIYDVEATLGQTGYSARFEVLSGGRGRLRAASDAPLLPELLLLRWDVQRERCCGD